VFFKTWQFVGLGNVQSASLGHGIGFPTKNKIPFQLLDLFLDYVGILSPISEREPSMLTTSRSGTIVYLFLDPGLAPTGIIEND
jgi:hypothetical protein